MVSGSGTNLQAILDAVKADELNAEIAAVGADKPCTGLDRAAAAADTACAEASAAHP